MPLPVPLIFHEDRPQVHINRFAAQDQAVGGGDAAVLFQFPQHVFLVQHIKNLVHVFFMDRDGDKVQAAFKKVYPVRFYLQLAVFLRRTEFNERIGIKIHIINGKEIFGQSLGDMPVGHAVHVNFFIFFLLRPLV